MRGRLCAKFDLRPDDVQTIEQIARSQILPWFQVQRARIVVALAEGQRPSVVAATMQCDRSTVWRVAKRYREKGLDGLLSYEHRSGRPQQISPVQRAQIVRLACLEPIAKGLHLTHWSSDDLARQACEDEIVDTISPRTVRRILDEVDLQPHRTRYWKTSQLDTEFKQRAEKVLWCYGNAQRLAEKGYWVVCVDEKPNCQVLERQPIRRAVPGNVEQQEFEYKRHGVVSLLFFLIVHTGEMELKILPQKNAARYIQELRAFRQRHLDIQGVYLIQDNDPAHTAGATTNYFRKEEHWWRPRNTPVRASWLDQAEILIHRFSSRYLQRNSWSSCDEYIDHVLAAESEFNCLYASPIEWTWTNGKMRKWFAKHTS